ncbi:PAP/25A associated domain containing protein [Trichomonas vaginalis G3]|uniref:PAP/25A associated domain containing protein n=1 Tax=Trichomonas vaginalis (strain ATCC PRA-98 / G3) TaxID=412133 RepID=A2F3R4_TRIV3|nr:polynucleotide adenylyltransferase protein [Trichomonas vaginalis G3]EAY00436.1 PAP/25A associated domain containing protein [Trichomonas vaginalis G3]KAI5493471.1 polynucleotide adenylyltransferase protein [Trichomonas vaginalis G3]|eukprot:XP_001313365.1 PAP/25A associated domain containing protein [Trichomonas vaginalis G3]
MQFFQWADKTLSQNKVIPFPEEGLAYLERPPPSDPVLSKFHEQLVKFIKQLIPTKADVNVRQYIVDQICDKIKKSLPCPKDNKLIVLPCGSCMSGTFLPNADIDFAIFYYPIPCNPVNIMQQLQTSLAEFALDGFNPLPQAKVPVLKFMTNPGISIDISFDELHGPLCVQTIREIFRTIPCILPAQIFLKAMLRRNKLDQPFLGGISSYTLQLMILAYVQYAGEPDNITDLIVGFCNFYGNIFNFTLTGIDVTEGGQFFSRAEENKLSPDTPSAMYIQDPLNSNNVLGHNAFKMNEIREELRVAHQQVISGNGEELINTLLGEIIEIHTIHDVIREYAMDKDISLE